MSGLGTPQTLPFLPGMTGADCISVIEIRIFSQSDNPGIQPDIARNRVLTFRRESLPSNLRVQIAKLHYQGAKKTGLMAG